MMNKESLRKMIGGILIGGMVLAQGGVAMADNANTSTVTNHVKNFAQMQKWQEGAVKGDPTQGIKTSLDKLVTAGTISQTQEDQIVAAMKAKVEAQKANMEKMKTMTEAERTAAMQSKDKQTRPDFLADLVTAGTITQAQADAIKEAMPQGHQEGQKPGAEAPETTQN